MPRSGRHPHRMKIWSVLHGNVEVFYKPAGTNDPYYLELKNILDVITISKLNDFMLDIVQKKFFQLTTLNNLSNKTDVYAQAIGVGVICAAKLGYWTSIV